MSASRFAYAGMERLSYLAHGFARASGGVGGVAGGLLLAGARWYEPGLGRFLSEDPGPASELDRLNAYAYAAADPVNRLDPWGTSSVPKNGGRPLNGVSRGTVTAGGAGVFSAVAAALPTVRYDGGLASLGGSLGGSMGGSQLVSPVYASTAPLSGSWGVMGALRSAGSFAYELGAGIFEGAKEAVAYTAGTAAETANSAVIIASRGEYRLWSNVEAPKSYLRTLDEYAAKGYGTGHVAPLGAQAEAWGQVLNLPTPVGIARQATKQVAVKTAAVVGDDVLNVARRALGEANAAVSPTLTVARRAEAPIMGGSGFFVSVPRAALAETPVTLTVKGNPVRYDLNSLYHYTNEAGMNGIIESGNLRPSLWSAGTKDVRYGNGQYLSDIAPGTKTPADLSRAFLRIPFQGQRFTHFVEVDVSGLPVIQGRSGVFVVPNSTPLDVGGRIISSGRVPIP